MTFLIELWRPGPVRLADTEMLGDVLYACVHAGASVSFILPFSRDDALAFWRDTVRSVHAGEGDDRQMKHRGLMLRI